MFSVCLSVHALGGGTPVPGSFPGLWFKVLSGGYPSPGRGGVLQSWSGGYPSPGGGREVPQDRGYPPARKGYAAGGMPRAVSRRRTFL